MFAEASGHLIDTEFSADSTTKPGTTPTAFGNTVQTAIALLRNPTGKVSAIMSQKTGPRPFANDAM